MLLVDGYRRLFDRSLQWISSDRQSPVRPRTVQTTQLPGCRDVHIRHGIVTMTTTTTTTAAVGDLENNEMNNKMRRGNETKRKRRLATGWHQTRSGHHRATVHKAERTTREEVDNKGKG